MSLNKSEFYRRDVGPEVSSRETREKIKGSRTNPFSDDSNEDEWRNRAKIYRKDREGAKSGGGVLGEKKSDGEEGGMKREEKKCARCHFGLCVV